MISYMSTHWYYKWYHRLSSIQTKCKTRHYPHTSIDKLLSGNEIYIKTSINQKTIKNQLQNVIDMGSKHYLHWYHKHWYHKWYHRLSVHSALPLAAPDPACSIHSFLVSAALIPALADTLTPDSLSLRDGHHPGATPAVAPRPNVHLVESAAVAPILLCVSWGTPKTLIIHEGM